MILGSLIEQGRDGPYHFCDYVYNVWVTCQRCNNTHYDRTTFGNALSLILRQNTRDSVRKALDETLNGNLNENRRCVRCGGSGIYEKFEFIHTNQFFIIQINSTFGE